MVMMSSSSKVVVTVSCHFTEPFYIPLRIVVSFIAATTCLQGLLDVNRFAQA